MAPGSLEVVSPGPDRCGEGPIWDADRGRLLWTDIEAQVIYELRGSIGGSIGGGSGGGSGDRRAISRGVPASGIALDRGGALVLAGSAGLLLWREGAAPRSIAAEHEGEQLVFNDVLAEPGGGAYAGTLHWGPGGMEKAGLLYLARPGQPPAVVDEGIQLANGLGLSPDDRTLYFTDSAARRIYAYDVDRETGALRGRRVFVQVPGEEGIPDGLTVDSEGHVWSAQWYGAQVVRYDPDGAVKHRIRLPVAQTASLAFGGRDLRDLYITTAADAWPSALAPSGYDARGPQGGALYRTRLEVPGRLEHRTRFDSSSGPAERRFA